MREKTLFACLLLLSVGASANATYNNPGCRQIGEAWKAPHPLPPPPGTPIIRDFRLLADGETLSTAHNPLTLVPGDPPVIVRETSESQIPAGEEVSQNAPPTIRDIRTDKPIVPPPPDTPTVRSALTDAPNPPLMPADPPTVRDLQVQAATKGEGQV